MTDTADKEAIEISLQAIELAARVIHRYRHPSFDFGEYRCHCRADATTVAAMLLAEDKDES
jgi:hypothetical protein